MKHAMLLVAALPVIAAVIGAGPAMAQSHRGYNFLIAGELGFAATPEQFTDYYSLGFGGGVGIEYPVSRNWSLIGLFDLKLFSPAAGMIEDWWTEPDEYPHATNIEVSEGRLTAGTIAVLGKGSLRKEGTRFFPYIKGGFGITIAGADEIKVTYNDPAFTERQTRWQAGAGSETNVSIILGLGVEKVLGNGNSSLFVDVGVHMIMQEGSNPTVAPITVGLKF